MKKNLNKNNLFNSKISLNNIISLLILTLGFFFICFNISEIFEIGVILIIIGFLLTVFNAKGKIDTHLEKVLMLLLIWIMLIYVISYLANVEFEIIFFLVLIGLLVIHEFTSKTLSLYQKKRIYFSIIIFTIIVFWILIKNIMNMSGV